MAIKFSSVVLNGVEAKRESLGMSKNMDISVGIDAAKKTSKGLDFSFSYLVKYSPGVGFLKLVGYVSLAGPATEINALHQEWKKNKKINKKYAQKMVNLITYVASVNGIFAAKTLNLAPPFMSPQIDLEM